ncbi:MAG: acyl-CoA oxidase [Flammeovirgaceae bacterium]|nr:acyl-CoA oxidase [Flammeovirgaceae bacterium]MBR09654.1 acyl-CoA oxidase [Rickettsiales bacterium]|tara:strand:- start:1140 stop:3455 length:2316 start_codon:yes stop_codon:yes gene_type:complete
MIESKYFQANPHLFSFLPIMYMVWADAVLTPSEILKIRDLVDQQGWITGEDKKFIMSYLDPQNPPKPSSLKRWLEEIRKVSGNLTKDMKKSLVDIGIELARLNARNQNDESLDLARAPLTDLEEALGILSREAAYHLRFHQQDSMAGTEETGNSELLASEVRELLEGDNKDLIRKVKIILSDPEFAYYQGESKREYREQVLKWCQYLAEQGFGSLAYPKFAGGQEDMKGYFTVMETLSYHDLSMVIKFGVQFGLWGMSVYFLGTEKHHKKYLKDIGSLKLPGCFAMTETGHGSNVKGLETTATYNHETKTILIHTPSRDAGKEYIGNAALHGQKATVFAKLIIDDTDYGVNAFVVPLRNEKGELQKGVTIEDCGPKMGLNGVDNGRIWFDQVEIPVDDMLDRFASIDEEGKFQSPITSDNRRFFTMLGTLVGGRIGIPRSGLSALKSGLSIAIQYGDGRRQFGPENGKEVPILNYRTHQRRLMPLLAQSYALHFALQYLTNRFLNRTEEEMQEIEALAAGLKAYTTWKVTAGLQECREACGGKGYLSENRIDRLKNDTDIYTTFEGDNTVLMQLVAKSRLSEFKKEFADINLFGALSYIANQAKTSISEKNPVTIRSTDEDHLLDFDFLFGAFKYRETDILTSAAKRIKKHIDNEMDSFDAFNQTQYHMLNVGFAYIERVVLEQFVSAIETMTDGPAKQSMTRLCQLYGLHTIEVNKGWYLEHDYMEGVKTKAIRKLINKLCFEVRKDALVLVDAFDIPDTCLAAPIATKS